MDPSLKSSKKIRTIIVNYTRFITNPYKYNSNKLSNVFLFSLTLFILFGIIPSAPSFKNFNKKKYEKEETVGKSTLRLLQSQATNLPIVNSALPINYQTFSTNETKDTESQLNVTSFSKNDTESFFQNFYEDYPQIGVYSIKFNNTDIINSMQFTIQTKIDFFNETKKNDFSLDLSGNIIKFLGPFFTSDLTRLAQYADYKSYISQLYNKRTILIGIDGLMNSCVNFEKLSAFKYLMDNGSYNFYSRSTTEGLSGPGWSSVLCSLSSKDTGIVNNDWRAPWVGEENKAKYNFVTPINGIDKSFPCIFDELKKKKKINTTNLSEPKNFTNYVYSSWSFFRENFGNKAYPNTLDVFAECQIRTNQSYFEYIMCDNHSLDKTKNFLLQDFDFYFWYMGSLDVAGHTFSFCGTEYESRVNNINNILNEFFEYLKILNLIDKVNIIITSDHGADRSNMNHGKDKWDGNLLVPLFMMGPDFKKNYVISGPTSGIDIAPTIMKLYNLPINDLWTGKPIKEALIENQNFDNSISQQVVLEGSLLNFSYKYWIIFFIILDNFFI